MRFFIVVATGALWSATLHAQQSAPEGVLSGGHWLLGARYRVESVDQDGPLKSALASTLRTHAGFETNPDLPFGALVEVEDVHAIGNTRFNSTTNGQTGYAAVPDPDGTEINQAYLAWRVSGFQAKAGRQALVLDNSRFIGDVGFRQNQQTFDAASLQATSPGGSRFTYDYLWRVNRFLGPDNPQGELKLRTHLFNYSLGRLNGDRLTAYAYLVEFADAPSSSGSTQTLGVSYDGSLDMVNRKLLYRLEYANQADYADNPSDTDTWYGNAELGVRFVSQWTITAGLELLSGNGRTAFQAPLGTLHKFNGHADLFAGGTPASGLDDRYVRLYAPVAGARITLAWHDFKSDTGGTDFGSEIDAELNWRLTTQWLIGIKYADYRADAFATDTRKAWVWVQADLD